MEDFNCFNRIFLSNFINKKKSTLKSYINNIFDIIDFRVDVLKNIDQNINFLELLFDYEKSLNKDFWLTMKDMIDNLLIKIQPFKNRPDSIKIDFKNNLIFNEKRVIICHLSSKEIYIIKLLSSKSIINEGLSKNNLFKNSSHVSEIALEKAIQRLIRKFKDNFLLDFINI